MKSLKLEEVCDSEEWYSQMLKRGYIGLTSQGYYLAYWVDDGSLISADSQDDPLAQGSLALQSQLEFLNRFTLYLVVEDVS